VTPLAAELIPPALELRIRDGYDTAGIDVVRPVRLERVVIDHGASFEGKVFLLAVWSPVPSRLPWLR
jgi:hypothetical protein